LPPEVRFYGLSAPNPPYPLVGFKGPTSKGREGREGKGTGAVGKEEKGRGGKGRGRNVELHHLLLRNLTTGNAPSRSS